MAKQRKSEQGHNGKNDKGHGKQHAVNMGDIGRASAHAEACRTRKNKVARLLNARRNAERQAGEFYVRVNAGRSSDLSAALRGEVGEYAYPGGDQPSIHFMVSRELRGDDVVAVIRLESIQRGHALVGELFDPKIYVPCFYVGKFGFEFRSRFKDRLAAVTQELIVHYLANPDGYVVTKTTQGTPAAPEPTPTVQVEVEPSKEDSIFTTASREHQAMLAEQVGDYLIPSLDGDVVVSVFERGSKKVLRVAESMNPSVMPGSFYLPVYLLFRPSLEQVTSDEVYQAQLALFLFVRTELAELISRSKAVGRYVAPPAKQPKTPVATSEVIEAPPVRSMLERLTPPEPEEETVDVTGSQSLKAAQFLSRNATGIFHHQDGDTLAYFRWEKIAGNPSAVLIAVEEDHPLAACLVAHQEVHVHLQDLRQDDRPYDSDLANMRNARECLRQYLRQVAMTLGIRPLTPKRSDVVTSVATQ